MKPDDGPAHQPQAAAAFSSPRTAGASRRWLAVMQLVRLPNLPSAAADVLMGYWIMSPPDGDSWSRALAFVIVASGSLYAAGMVWNDVFDFAEDARDRPRRPLPSGALSLPFAMTFGGGLIGVGILAAAGSGAAAFWVACVLAATILAYDGGLKQTPVGPVAMGACRLLNVLLGMAAVAAGGWSEVMPTAAFDRRWVVPLGNGIYIAGLTWFARQEAGISARAGLIGGATVLGTGLLLQVSIISAAAPFRGLGLAGWGGLLAWLGWRMLCALRAPNALSVQAAVKAGIMGLIVLDAVVVASFRGPGYAGLVLALLPPALLLGRWLYST